MKRRLEIISIFFKWKWQDSRERLTEWKVYLAKKYEYKDENNNCSYYWYLKVEISRFSVLLLSLIWKDGESFNVWKVELVEKY